MARWPSRHCSDELTSLKTGAAVLVGRDLIVHADPDDFKTQPAGKSGAGIDCGAIQVERLPRARMQLSLICVSWE